MLKNRKVIIILVAFLLIGLVGCNKKEEKTAFTEGFAVDFLKLENNGKNMIYSPLSIKYALSMLNDGAAETTKDEIESAIKNLKFPKYENIDKNLSFANAVFIRDSYKEYAKESYTDTLKQKYAAEVHYDSFANANNVNKFVEEKTLGIIKSILDDDSIQDPNLKLILINALAIDMKWEIGFSTANTYGADFNLENGTKMTATTMHASRVKSDAISYYKDDKITALLMNLQKYGDTQLEFMAIMPSETLTEYVKKFKVEEFDNIKNKLTLSANTQNGLNITIPKFKYDYNLNLKSDLQTLGIKEAFTNEANFSNMTSNSEGLHIDSALHKADIEFSEEGIKAAAVTAIMVTGNSIMPQEKPEEIVIDNPFLYAIRDKANGEIWFVGTVYEPNLWENDKVAYQR